MTSPRDDFEASIEPLWTRAAEGDREAYHQCLGLLATRLRAYFARRLGSRVQDIEDLVQETLLAIHAKRETHASGMPVSNWALSIGRYKLVDHFRRSGRQKGIHEPIDERFAGSVAAPSHEPSARRDVAVLLAKLPRSQSDALHLTRIEGLSVVEAATQIGVSPSALKARIHRGLAHLAGLVRTP